MPVASIIGIVFGSISGLISSSLSSFGLYSLLVETGNLAPIGALEGIFHAF